MILVSFWRSPGDHDSSDLWSYVEAARLMAFQRNMSFGIIGDFNPTPEENFLTSAPDLQLVAWTEDGEWVPTRWEGKRAIDYCLVSTDLQGSSLGFRQAKFGDHKAMAFALQRDTPRLDYKAVAPTTSFASCSCPSSMRAALENMWEQDDPQLPADVIGKAEWRWLSICLEDKLLAAAIMVDASFSPGFRGARPFRC